MGIALIGLAIAGATALSAAGLVLCTALIARHAQAAAQPLGRFIDVDHARLHYVDRGNGPVIVMVHGLGGNLRNFNALIDELAATHRVVAVDRPGCGYSTMRSGAQPALREQAAIIAQFLGSLGLDRPLLVGHSFGGALSLALALEHRAAVRALVLISTLSQVEHVPPAVFKPLEIHSPILRWISAWTLMAPLGMLTHRATLDSIFAPESVPKNFDGESGSALSLRPYSFVAASKDMISVAGELAIMAPLYPSLTIPVDVVFGREDPILDYRTHGERLAAALPNATLHLIDGGHMIPITAAGTVANFIKHAQQRAASG